MRIICRHLFFAVLIALLLPHPNIFELDYLPMFVVIRDNPELVAVPVILSILAIYFLVSLVFSVVVTHLIYPRYFQKRTNS